ncbi:MotA/TolQ/ExbB proton channel family protein [Schlesneria sp. T3-172]|uniref:MotA/TolQ/ExbB proton channel family protein n=1 Tax=Schlesneria sphaerica TaxID=3373610 RepID=UPI0037C640E7
MKQVKGIEMNQTVVRSRLWCLVLALLVGGLSFAQQTSTSFAQDDEKAVSVDDRSGGDAKAGEAKKPQETFLMWMIRASGIFGFLIMLVSFAMVAIIMMIALQLRRDNYLPTAFIEEFEQRLQSKDYQGAYETAKSSDSFIGRIMAEGMGRLTRGYDEAVEQMQQVAEDETMAMEHKIGYLALIGSIAPMLGLLGTVQGMVMSFQVIANSATSPKPSELADGIATALFTTLEGLTVAIPAIIFYSLYKNRLARFLMECGFVAENLMKNFQNAGKTTAPAAASRAGGAAPAAAPSVPRNE